MPSVADIQAFRYLGVDVDADRGEIRCHYGLDDEFEFTETIELGPFGDVDREAVARAARLAFMLAGVSYYKAAAPPVIDLGPLSLTAVEAAVLRRFYLHGLGEYAYRNELDLTDVEFVGPLDAVGAPHVVAPGGRGPLVPFGGGIDSIVSTEWVRTVVGEPTLFVVARPGDRFAAIEAPAAVSGLTVRHVGRTIDPQLLRSTELGFRNGHVPITGILSAIAVLAAVAGGHDSVVMSNEWSASSGNVEVDGRTVNHQYSKSLDFERDFRALVAESLTGGPDYFSLLRPLSELRIARQFAEHVEYHGAFRSCNRSFHQDPADRLDHWCGVCDKCAFIDLILAPYLDVAALEAVFAETVEPLQNPAMRPAFDRLVGLGPDLKPWECVGDVGECRVATVLAAARADRADHPLLQALADDVAAEGGAIDATVEEARLMRPLSEHFVPSRYGALDGAVHR